MRFAFSNIGLAEPRDGRAFDTVRAAGITGIEIAPTKLWPDWLGATPDAAREHRGWLKDRGFEVPALQAVLFGRPELQLFGPPSTQQALIGHLIRVADLASAFGAKVVVLGAPRNRDRGALDARSALDVAVPLLRQIGEAYAQRGACLCIEPNPPRYQCNFITTAAEGRAIVTAVDSPGFGLHLDSAALILGGDDVTAELRSSAQKLRHFHLSEPNLGGFAAPTADHLGMLQLLAVAGYEGWASFEVSATLHDLAETCSYARKLADALGRD